MLFIKFPSFPVSVRSAPLEFSLSFNKPSIYCGRSRSLDTRTVGAVLANTAHHYPALSRCSERYVPSGTGSELKNHCFTSEEYNGKLRAYYDTLYHYKEIFRKDLDKLESDYSIYSNNGMSGRFNNFEEWFSDRTYYSDYKPYLYFYYKDVYNILNSGYKKSKQSYDELREYERTLACIQAILDETKEEMEESLSNIEITNNLDKYINASENSPVINKVIIDGNQITFVISKNEQIQGVFNNKLKNTLGKPYKGNYDKALCTNEGNLILCEKSSMYYGGDQIFLIVNKKDAYKLSPKATQLLYRQGYFR